MEAIILNGPMGVGKTTVGNILAERLPGTAFIDGDWCMDLHPFVGNDMTRAMAADNILHMAGNYMACPHCKGIIIVWLIDVDNVFERLKKGLTDLGLNVKTVTLVCSQEQLRKQWQEDTVCPWRTDDLLEVSLRSLPFFLEKADQIDITGLTSQESADKILKEKNLSW